MAADLFNPLESIVKGLWRAKGRKNEKGVVCETCKDFQFAF
jgi:hypothetical protein